jgi:hypothetical protein
VIYSVGPNNEVDGTRSTRRWPALVRNLMATLALMAVALSGGVTAIWLVLAPVMPAGAATTQLQQRSSQLAPTRSADPSTEPTTGAPDAPATTPRTAEQADWLRPPVLAKQVDETKAVANHAGKCSRN